MTRDRAAAAARSLCWIACVLLVALYACLFHRYAVDFPRVDDFSQILAVPHYAALEPTLLDRARYVLSLSVEHRIATLRLAALAQVALAGRLDFVALMLAGAIVLACAGALVVSRAPRDHRAWVALVAIALAISPVNYEAQFWATGALQHFGVIGLALVALWCFDSEGPWLRALALPLAAAAALTSANGLMAFPAGVMVAWARGRKGDALAAGLATAVACALYFKGYEGNGTAAGFALSHAVALARFVAAAAGSIAVEPIASTMLGIALACAWGWLVIRRGRVPPVVLGWMAFLAMSYAAMAAGRVALGDEAALISRYRVYSATAIVVTIVALLHAWPRRAPPWLGAIAVAATAAWLALTWSASMVLLVRASFAQEITRATYLATGHGVYVPWPPQDYGDFLLDRAKSAAYFVPAPARDPSFLAEPSGRFDPAICIGARTP